MSDRTADRAGGREDSKKPKKFSVIHLGNAFVLSTLVLFIFFGLYLYRHSPDATNIRSIEELFILALILSIMGALLLLTVCMLSDALFPSKSAAFRGVGCVVLYCILIASVLTAVLRWEIGILVRQNVADAILLFLPGLLLVFLYYRVVGVNDWQLVTTRPLVDHCCSFRIAFGSSVCSRAAVL